jgi:tetratricopeptide (TPR) repeat protein
MSQAPSPSIDDLRRWQQAADYAAVRAAGQTHPSLANEPAAALVIELARWLQSPSEREQCAPRLRELLSDEPAPGELAHWADQGLAYLLLGDLERAHAILTEVVADPEAGAVPMSRMAATALARDDLEGAEHYYREALALEPDRVQWQTNLGGVLLRQQRLEEALACYEQALRSDPGSTLAREMRAHTLSELRRTDELVDEAEARFQAEPAVLERRLELAQALLLHGEPQRALRLVHQVAIPASEDAAPSSAEEQAEQCLLWSRLAQVHGLYQQHRLAAEAHFQARQYCTDPDEHHRAHEALHRGEAGQLEQAWDLVAEVLSAQPRSNLGRLAQASLMVHNGELEAAAALLEQALAETPNDLRLVEQLAQIQLWLGRLEEARRHYELIAEQNPLGLAHLISAQQFPDDPRAIELLTRLAERPNLAPTTRAQAQFALASLLERRGEHAAAFARLDAANALVRRQMLRYDPDAFSGLVDDLIRAFDRVETAVPVDGVATPTPIFVVGLPRSGTTLVEQILASHPQVAGGGELGELPRLARMLPRLCDGAHYPKDVPTLTPAQCQALGDRYLQAIRPLAGDALYLVDKLPHNFVHIGFIRRILPQARILHLERDPRDIALSSYQQDFKLKNAGMGYAFDLEHLARQINDHHRLMQHWYRVLPGQVYEVAYAALVSDPQTRIRALLDHLELPWDPAVLAHAQTERPVRTASVTQVRSGIYTHAVGRWQPYAQALKPLTDALSPELLARWSPASADSDNAG